MNTTCEHPSAGAERLMLSVALAVIVRAADHLEQGTSARRALAEAAQPLRRALGHVA